MESLTLTPDRTALVVVDVQERLAAAMPADALARVVQNVCVLVEAAGALGFPVVVTEQYPKGLGPTVAPVQEALAKLPTPPTRVEKMEFDATRCEAFAPAMERELRVGGRPRTVVLAGMEAHICVFQTARGLCARQFPVHVPFDATCSRNLENRRVAEGLWARVGAVPTTTESVLFDLLGRAGTEPFKAISKRVR